MNNDNIYLTGYRCVGKTGVGRLLAESTGLSYTDTDKVFVDRSGFTVAEYVAMHGWKSFRNLESAIINDLSRKARTVVATGGGVVLNPENISAMKSSGRVVWLRATPENIFRRMMTDPATVDMRPGLTMMSLADEIREILAQREPLYRAAMDVAVETDDLSMAEVCQRITDLLAEEKEGHK